MPTCMSTRAIPPRELDPQVGILGDPDKGVRSPQVWLRKLYDFNSQKWKGFNWVEYIVSFLFIWKQRGGLWNMHES